MRVKENEVYELAHEWFELKKADWGESNPETSKRCREIEAQVEDITNSDPIACIWGAYIASKIRL